MNKLKQKIGPYALVFSLAFIGFIGVVIFLRFGKKISPLLEPSVFSLTYQFLLLAILGGAVSFLFKELSRKKQSREEKLLQEKQSREEKLLREKQLREEKSLRLEENRRFNNERLREIHSDLLTAFNQAKTVRRIMRAFVFSTEDGGERVLRDDYDRQIHELNMAQLVFETYSKRAKYNKLWFEKAKNLSDNLKDIESYLNLILTEYQEKRKLFDGDPPSYPLSELPRLKEYIGPDDEWVLFDNMFKTPMRETLQSLDEARLS